MTAKVWGTSQNHSPNFLKLQTVMLLCLSTAVLLLGSQRQASASAQSEARITTHSTLSQLAQNSSQVISDVADLSDIQPGTNTAATQTVRLVIRLGERRVYVFRNDLVETSYPIAVGKSGWETPTGSYAVMQKLKDPSWEHPWTGEVVGPGPDNPLGTRWIGFWTDGTNVIGFHGTPNIESVGTAASHGCIRMYDEDVQALFDKVQVGTPVIVEP